MSYTPIGWETGDIVTAEKLNKMDEQIAENANAYVVTVAEDELVAEYITDKTFNEVQNAIIESRCVLFVKTGENGAVYVQKPVGYEYAENTYKILMSQGDYYMTDDPATIMQYYPF